MLTAGPQIEKAASSRIAVFDKTGTLTSGNLKMKEVQLEPEWKANEVRLWDMIRAVVQRSQHPVSRLLVQHSHCVIQETKEHCVAMVLSHEEVPGLGQQGHLTVLDQDYDIGIGNHRFMQARGVYLESVVSHSTGVLYVCVDGKLAMYATYEDEIIPEAANLVVELHVRGFRTYMMTGDTMENARDVALRAGIPVENVHASLLPHDKASLVESLERRYGPVIMVGDDLNDAPALAAATFGIITSRDRAAQSPKQDPRAVEILQKLHQEADALLTPDKSTASQPCGLIRVAYIVDLIRETFRRMRRILQWSLMYNTIALVMVSGGMNSVMPGTRWEGKVLDP
jgi:cation transport ATPase